MTHPTALSDDEFLRRFLDATMPAEAFDHRGHLRVTWLLLRRMPLDDAVRAAADGIARLAARLGAPGKFHRTVTEALVRTVAHRGATDGALSWPDFLQRNPDLVHDARGVLAHHYSDELLTSPRAREQFVAPDRQPLPA